MVEPSVKEFQQYSGIDLMVKIKAFDAIIENNSARLEIYFDPQLVADLITDEDEEKC